jgi:hypothetical protein
VYGRHGDGSPSDAAAGPGGLGSTRPAAVAAQPPVAVQRRAERREQDLHRYLEANAPRGEFGVVTDDWRVASRFILATRADVLQVGGFSGKAPTLSVPEYAALVARHAARFAIVGDGRPRGRSTAARFTRYVRGNCARVHDIVASPPEPSPVPLYDCAQRPHAEGAGLRALAQ